MIIVDSCVWIDYFRGVETSEALWLSEHFEVQLILIPDIIVFEVLRGFKNQKDFDSALGLFEDMHTIDILGFKRSVSAAKKYRNLRSIGVTVRKPGDAAIAAFCIDENHQLLTSDRDFNPYVKHYNLVLVKP